MAMAPSGGSAQDVPEQLVLENVPKIGYGVHLCPFPGSLYAVLQYLGDPVDYDYLMGVTGAAFRRLWNRDDGGNVDLMYFSPDPYARAAEALNRDLEPVRCHDQAEMLAALRDSLGRQHPVLAFGIIGPPECGIVTGYEEGGEVLRGWSYFQDAAVPGYYAKRNWYEEGKWAGDIGLILVGDRRRWSGPTPRAVLVSSLRWAVDLARIARRAAFPDHVCGLSAYEAWAEGLEVDADYPSEDAKVMGTRVMVHGDQCVMLEERHSAARYLRQVLDAAPEAAEELKSAADLYDEVAACGGKIWLWGGDMGADAVKGLGDPDTRHEIARNIRLAGEKEAQAVEHLEQALALIAAAPKPAKAE
jgi:hypothetical protein